MDKQTTLLILIFLTICSGFFTYAVLWGEKKNYFYKVIALDMFQSSGYVL